MSDDTTPDEVDAAIDGMRQAVEAAGGIMQVLNANIERREDGGMRVRLEIDEANYMEFSFNADGEEPMSMLLCNAEDMVTQALGVHVAREAAERARKAGLN